MTKGGTLYWAVIAADLPNDDDGFSPTNYPQYVEPRGDVVVGREVHTPDGHLSLYWEAPRSALVAMAPDPTQAARAVFVALHGSYAGSVKEHAAQHLADIAAARAEVAKLGTAVNTWAPRWVPDLDAREAEVLDATATTPLSRVETALALAKARPTGGTLYLLGEALREEEVGLLAAVYKENPQEAGYLDAWRAGRGRTILTVAPRTTPGRVWVEAAALYAKLPDLQEAQTAAYRINTRGEDGQHNAALVESGLANDPLCPELLRARAKAKAAEEQRAFDRARAAEDAAIREAHEAAKREAQRREAAMAAKADRDAGVRREARLVAFKAAVKARDWAALRALGPEPIKYYIAWDISDRNSHYARYEDEESQNAAYERREARTIKREPSPYAEFLRWWGKDPNAAEFFVACGDNPPKEAVDAFWAYQRQEPLDDMAAEAEQIQARLVAINRALGRK